MRIHRLATNTNLSAWYIVSKKKKKKKKSKDFNVSEYLAQKEQILKLADGILATPREKVGKSLKPQVKQAY